MRRRCEAPSGSAACGGGTQFVREFAKLGLTRSVGGVLALALSRELTPVVTCIILAGVLGAPTLPSSPPLSPQDHP